LFPLLFLGAQDPRLWTELHIGEKCSDPFEFSQWLLKRSKGRLRSIDLGNVKKSPRLCVASKILDSITEAGEGTRVERLRLSLETNQTATSGAFRFIQNAPTLKELTVSCTCQHYGSTFLLWLLWLPNLETLKYEQPHSTTIMLTPHPPNESEQDLKAILR
jgi:hypothetical protein